MDGNEDIIDCGKGTRDRAFIDEPDAFVDNNFKGCEKIIPVVLP